MKACFISSGLWASQENFKNFLKVTYRVGYKRVALNGQSSSWRPDLAGVPQGSTLGPLLFFICINDLPNEMKSNAKLFADDRSLSTIVKDKNESANVLNNYLLLISRWAYNSKMLFKLDLSKPAQEVIFSRKKQFQSHATISLNNIQVELWRYHIWPTWKWIFLWKTWIYTVESRSSNKRCRTRYFSWKNLSRVRTRIA